jgi:hypothetical protein
MELDSCAPEIYSSGRIRYRAVDLIGAGTVVLMIPTLLAAFRRGLAPGLETKTCPERVVPSPWRHEGPEVRAGDTSGNCPAQCHFPRFHEPESCKYTSAEHGG